MAAHFGVSKSTVRKVLNDAIGFSARPLTAIDKDHLEACLKTYKSIRLTTRVLNLQWSQSFTETDVRKAAKDFGIDLSSLLDWSLSEHSSGKGRRAEMDYARLRGDNILKDMNKEDGSQADYDFEDKDLGRVNVKSSRRWKLKAKTRADNPYYWKFSASGKHKATNFVCMAYDEEMKELLGVCYIYTAKLPEGSTFVLRPSDLVDPSCLSNLNHVLPPVYPTSTATLGASQTLTTLQDSTQKLLDSIPVEQD